MDENVAKFYRYRLIKNATADSMSVEGVRLKKDEWLVSKTEVQKLANWLNTPENPNGIVERDVFDANTEKSILVDREIFTAQQLVKMKRPEIVKIAESWDVKHIGKKKDKLIEILCDRFAKEEEATEEPEEPETPEEPVVDETPADDADVDEPEMVDETPADEENSEEDDTEDKES